jgi:3D (Asp-Asp-Asp) domain-containing protein
MLLFKKFDVCLLAVGIAIFTVSLTIIMMPMSVLRVKQVETRPIVIYEKQSIPFTATGYCLGDPYSSITKTGAALIDRGAAQIGGIPIFTIAVDPKVIPLGSLMYIDSLGLGIATDTGRAIRGTLIDVCFSNSKQAKAWGRREVIVTVINRSK